MTALPYPALNHRYLIEKSLTEIYLPHPNQQWQLWHIKQTSSTQNAESTRNVLQNWSLNTLRPRQNGRHFADNTFKCIFLNENVGISITISLKFVPKDPNINNSALVQIMAWCRSGDKPLSEPMMVSLLTHICVTRPQWVKKTQYAVCISSKT